MTACFVQVVPVPGSEIICIFDADQVAKPEFFLRTLPLFDSGDDVGMVLSPQCFHNLDYHTDIFNHSNRQFWEYMQPGYDAWGFISCTGQPHRLPQRHVALLTASPRPPSNRCISLPGNSSSQ